MSTYRSALIFTFFGFYIKVCFLKVYQFLLEKRRIQIKFKSYENEIDMYVFVELVLLIIVYVYVLYCRVSGYGSDYQ